MSAWITPIIDRTQADVDRAKELIAKGYSHLTVEEKAEWDAGLKGCFNRSDIDRIMNNIGLLGEVLEISVPTWNNPPYTPLQQDISLKILYPVSIIRGAYSVYEDTPPAPSLALTNLDYKVVNDIEKILLDVYTIIMSNFYYDYTDEITMGDEVGLIL